MLTTYSYEHLSKNFSLDHKINSPVIIDRCYQMVIWQNQLVCHEIFLFFKTQRRHHTVSENIQGNVLFQSFKYKCGPCGYFNTISEKHLRYSLFFKKNNCYRSTTLLFGLGQTIMYNVIMHYLFLPCSIRNLALASLFTIKIEFFCLSQVLIPTVVFFHESNY